MDLYSFGEWVKQRREQLRITQRELAITVHCSVSMIKKIEADERRPSPEIAELLANALKLPDADQGIFVEVASGARPVDFLTQGPLEAEVSPAAPFHTPVSLPKSATPFIGRHDELADIGKRLADPTCRLLTLVGPGGIGKTRLAIAAAQAQQATFVEGVAFVPLAAVTDAALIPDAIAYSLHVTLTGEPAEQVLAYLRRRSMLLVLDNCEQLEGELIWISDLLDNASGIKVIATSRARLQLTQECVYGVPELAQAVSLFVATARRVKVDFDDRGVEPTVARICQLVGNLPLAVELAAAWVRVMPCAEIARELEQSLDILATGLRNVPEKHRSMRAAFEHSWMLLSADEQAVFRRLSVFRGGFTREAAEQVAGASLSTLAALIDKSLLRVDANGRYDVHELLRQYAREKLTEATEATVVLDQHRDYILAFAERSQREFFGANQLEWLNRLDIELGNIRAAIGWSVECGDVAVGLRLTGALYWFWAVHGYHHEGYERLMHLLSLPGGNLRLGIRARALNGVGIIQWFNNNNEVARPLLEEAIAIAREVGDFRELAVAVRFLGHVLYNLGEFGAAGPLLEESLELSRKLQDRAGACLSLDFLGDLALQQGDTERAQQLYQESIDLIEELKEKALTAYTLRRLGFVMRGYKDYERAKAFCRESLALNFATGDRRSVAASLVGLAGLAIAQDNAVHAAQLLAAADRLLNEIAAHLLLVDQLEYEHHLERVQTQLDAVTFNRAWSEGQSMTMERAVAFAVA